MAGAPGPLGIVWRYQRGLHGSSGAGQNWSWVVSVICLFVFRNYCSFVKWILFIYFRRVKIAIPLKLSCDFETVIPWRNHYSKIAPHGDPDLSGYMLRWYDVCNALKHSLEHSSHLINYSHSPYILWPYWHRSESGRQNEEADKGSYQVGHSKVPICFSHLSISVVNVV